MLTEDRWISRGEINSTPSFPSGCLLATAGRRSDIIQVFGCILLLSSERRDLHQNPELGAGPTQVSFPLRQDQLAHWRFLSINILFFNYEKNGNQNKETAARGQRQSVFSVSTVSD